MQSRNSFFISVIRKGLSMRKLKESFSLLSTDVNDLSFDCFVDSVVSLHQEKAEPANKNKLKRKVIEEESSPQLTPPKRPCLEHGVEKILKEAKLDIPGGMGTMGCRFLYPVTLLWKWGNEMKSLSFYALIDTGADTSVFDLHFVMDNLIP